MFWYWNTRSRSPNASAQQVTQRLLIFLAVFVLIAFGMSSRAQPQNGSGNRNSSVPKDPGVRDGPPGAGQPIAGLTLGELDFFTRVGQPVFSEVDTVAEGLGPRFNLDSCAGCHAFPAVGGSSPAINPQVTHLTAMAPGNTIPNFLSRQGPIREARFVNNNDGTPDGGVHALFTISGRSDKPAGCSIASSMIS